jgi:hypothetical protein
MEISSARRSTFARPNTVRKPAKEQVALAAGEPGIEPTGLRRILGHERDEVPLDVGILADDVGVRVVAAVLGHPPGVADADEEVGDQSSGQVVGPARFEDLAVGCLVGEKGELGEDQSEGCGEQQLEPGFAQQDHPGDGGRECPEKSGEHAVVEAPAALKKAGIPDGSKKGRVLGRRIRTVAAWLRLGEGDDGSAGGRAHAEPRSGGWSMGRPESRATCIHGNR